MGTHAAIGFFDADKGEAVWSFLHYDGYPSHAGVILARSFADVDKARALVTSNVRGSFGLCDLGWVDEKSEAEAFEQERGAAHTAADAFALVKDWDVAYSYLYDATKKVWLLNCWGYSLTRRSAKPANCCIVLE